MILKGFYVVYSYVRENYEFFKIVAEFLILDHAIEFVEKRLSFGYGESVTFTIVENLDE